MKKSLTAKEAKQHFSGLVNIAVDFEDFSALVGNVCKFMNAHKPDNAVLSMIYDKVRV